MMPTAVHQFLGALLLGLTLADALFLRAPVSHVFRPEELLKRWRRTTGLLQMGLFIAVVALGVSQWWPLRQGYAPATFHSKMALAVVFLLLAKVRMIKERRSGQMSPHLTRAMLGTLAALFLLGATST